MAGLNAAPNLGEQLALIAGLRWRLFRNSLQTRRGRFELFSLILIGLLLGGLALGAGLGLGATAFVFARHGHPEFLGVLLWTVFLFWQLFPLLIVAAATQFDFRSLLRFPVQFGAYFLLSLAYGLFDPAAVVAQLWLVCIAGGIFLAKPAMLAGLLVIFGVFAVVNLLLNRLILVWLERLLARRHAREAFLLLFFAGLLIFQLSSSLAQRRAQQFSPLGRRLLRVAGLLPPGLTQRALAAAAAVRPAAEAVTPIALLVSDGLVFALMLRHRLLAQYRGEHLGESPAPVIGVARGARRTWRLPGLRDPLAALVEKELRYLSRNGPDLLILLLPSFYVVLLGIALRRPGNMSDFLYRSPELVLPLASVYGFLMLVPLAHNSFGLDGTGIQLVLLSPAQFRDVLLAKNLVHCLVAVFEVSAAWVLLALLFRPPGLVSVLYTFLALVFAVPAELSVANLLSIYFPKRLEFGDYWRTRIRRPAILAGIATQLSVLGIAAGVFWLAYRLGRLWLAAVIFLLLGAGVIWLYAQMLGRCARIAAARREFLVEELSRQSGRGLILG